MWTLSTKDQDSACVHSREGEGGYRGSGKQDSASSWASERGWRLEWLWVQLTFGSALHSAHGGSAVCSDCNTDTDIQPKEQALHPQPVSRESGQPGPPSSQELRQHDGDCSPHHPYTGTADGSPTHSGGTLYPSNHDRIVLSLKKRAAPPGGKGKCCVGGVSGWVGALRGVSRLTYPLVFHRRFLLDFSKVT